MRFSFLYKFLVVSLLLLAGFSSTSFIPIHKNVCRHDAFSKPFSIASLVWDDPELLFEFDSLIIPIKRAGKLLMVECKIDNQTGNLIFDTGASGLVLNRTYFRDNIRTESVTPTGITGSVGKIFRTSVDSLEINGLLYRNIKADLADLGHIENRRGVKVLGLFGFNLLRNFEIIIDIQNNELKLIRVDKKGNRLNGESRNFKSDYTQAVFESNCILFVNAEIGGKSFKLCFDTGAEINAISNGLNKLALNTISITRRTKLGGAGSSTSEVFYGTMNDFKFGNRSLTNMQTIITNLDPLVEAYDVPFSGVLGYDFLEKGIICINLRKKQLGINYFKAEEV